MYFIILILRWHYPCYVSTLWRIYDEASFWLETEKSKCYDNYLKKIGALIEEGKVSSWYEYIRKL